MPAPSQRRALGALFLVLAGGFAAIVVAAARADQWVIVFAAAVLGLWLTSLALSALRRR